MDGLQYITKTYQNFGFKPLKNGWKASCPKLASFEELFFGSFWDPNLKVFLLAKPIGNHMGVEPKIGGFFLQNGWFIYGEPY